MAQRKASTKKKRTKYQIMKARATSFCKGKGKKSTLTKAIAAYSKDAAKKGKSKKEIAAIVSRVTSCSK